jgi:hypothetical protein
MIQKHNSKIIIVHYIGLKKCGQFQQYADNDV